MDFKKPTIRLSVTFGSMQGRLLAPSGKFAAITDGRAPDVKIRSGYNPYYVWRKERGFATEDVARAMGVSRKIYIQFEHGKYLGLSDEAVERFCVFCSVHPAGLVEVGVPIAEPVMNALIRYVYRNDVLSPGHELAVMALQAEADDAYHAIGDERARCNSRAQMDLVLPLLDFLEDDFALGGTNAPDPEDVVILYRQNVNARLGEMERKSTKPPFARDHIWRSYSDAALRLYGTNSHTSQNLENLRRPFKKYAWEWSMVCDMVRRDPEILHPMVWQDDMGAQFVGGKLLNREQAVEAMLGNYRAHQEREVRLASAGRDFVRFRSLVLHLEECLRSDRGRAVIAFNTNRQAAQCVLGTQRDALVSMPALPPPVPF